MAWQKWPRGPNPPSSVLKPILAESPHVPVPGNCLSGQGNPCPGAGAGLPPAGAPRWSWDRGTVAGILVWKWLQLLTAPACLCLSDEDFQARRQQLREEEETPKEGQ